MKSSTTNHAEPATAGQYVVDEVKAPALVGTLRQGHRRARADRPLEAAATMHRQAFLAVKPENFFWLISMPSRLSKMCRRL